MTAATWALSLPLIAEVIFGPVNLWTGRTIENWIRFTGLSPGSARVVAAPLKLVTAVLLAAGIWLRDLGAAGAGLAVAIALFYLVRLAHPRRRARDGIAAFTIFGMLAAGLLVVQLGR